MDKPNFCHEKPFNNTNLWKKISEIVDKIYQSQWALLIMLVAFKNCWNIAIKKTIIAGLDKDAPSRDLITSNELESPCSLNTKEMISQDTWWQKFFHNKIFQMGTFSQTDIDIAVAKNIHYSMTYTSRFNKAMNLTKAGLLNTWNFKLN